GSVPRARHAADTQTRRVQVPATAASAEEEPAASAPGSSSADAGPAQVGSLGPDLGGAGGSEGLSGSDSYGEGGGGSGKAYARYGENPPPPFPESARRNNQQGAVLLRVLVAADGSVARIEVLKSSGFGALDGAAYETVRRRWRFVPAERNGVPVASWVLVPIRFALREDHAATP